MKNYRGPAAEISDLPKDYEPVACEFTDDLEHLSVLKSQIEIKYFNEAGQTATLTGLITDIFTTQKKEEYLKINNENLIRLDRIIEINLLEKGL